MAPPNFLGTVSVIARPGNTVVATIPVGSSATFPNLVAVAPNGKHAYVLNSSSNIVSVIDTATNTVVGLPIPVGSGPRQLREPARERSPTRRAVTRSHAFRKREKIRVRRPQQKLSV